MVQHEFLGQSKSVLDREGPVLPSIPSTLTVQMVSLRVPGSGWRVLASVRDGSRRARKVVASIMTDFEADNKGCAGDEDVSIAVRVAMEGMM